VRACLCARVCVCVCVCLCVCVSVLPPLSFVCMRRPICRQSRRLYCCAAFELLVMCACGQIHQAGSSRWLQV
jgi:hypothetical protein